MMTSIKYRQERINPMFIAFPAIFILVGLGLVGLIVFTKSDSMEGTLFTLIFGLVFLIVGIGLLYSVQKKVIAAKKEIEALRQKGRQLYGEILGINEHVTTTHTQHGTQHTYTYTFTVQYSDPDTFSPVIAESIMTYQKYEIKSPQCQIRVLDGRVLVENAYVEVVKPKFKPVVLIAFLLFIVLIVAKALNWF